MNPFLVSLAVFAALFGAALMGFRLRRQLPDEHLCDKTKDAVRIGMGSVGTMAALVLGLLVASTKSAYDTEKSEIIQLAAQLVSLDEVLANYGPEAAECRKILHVVTESALVRIWPDAKDGRSAETPDHFWSKELPVAIQQLAARTDAQNAFKSQAAQLAGELGQLRWLLFEQSQSSVSAPLLIIMVFWMALTYTSVSLFAPANRTVVIAQCLAALAVAGALFLILELDTPYHGLIRISDEPIRNALQQLGK